MPQDENMGDRGASAAPTGPLASGAVPSPAKPSVPSAELLVALFKKHPAPWSADEEPQPFCDTGDYDYPWIVRDANAREVLPLYEHYASGALEPLHQALAEMLVGAANAAASAIEGSAQDAQRLDPQGESAVAEGETPNPPQGDGQ